ncbi:MAG: NAD(P)-binding domain-containing protein [Deltaproteobacteria bacterium]|nr:NAD(P)-binding domain-containing protein [Deltaproteobacteria bacterium]
MKIAILGTGVVGHTVGSKLAQLGHEVRMGSRSSKNEKALKFVKDNEKHRASAGTFEDAAQFCELAFNCTKGSSSLAAMRLCGEEPLQGKILIDLANPLDEKGNIFTPRDDSLGEQIQRELPSTKVVKTLNTVNCSVMIDAAKVPGDHDLFICGNEQAAKDKVSGWLREWFGWKSLIDLGDITGARASESYLALWIRLWNVTKSPNFNVKIVRGS